MAQQNETGGATAVLRLDALSTGASPDRALDDLAIFSAPGVEAVFLWWLESNRRWAARNAANPLMPFTVGRDDLRPSESR